MTRAADNLDALLDRVAAGELDKLTPTQAAELEAYLNASPPAAARLADLKPPLESVLTKAAPPVRAARWEAMWERIESASAAPGGLQRGRILRLMHSHAFRFVAAAAACLLLLLTWRVVTSPAALAIRLSDNVEIEGLEVSDDASSVVSYLGEAGGPVIIGVFAEEGA